MSTTLTGQVPAGYSTPPFPSLWIPPDNITQVGSFLYYIQDIWRFTLLWTFIVYGAFHIFASIYAVSTQRQKLSYVWIVPVVFVVVAGIEALLAGSVVGLILGAIYQAGSFRMSTWIPFIWSWINLLVLILSSFSIHGGL